MTITSITTENERAAALCNAISEWRSRVGAVHEFGAGRRCLESFDLSIMPLMLELWAQVEPEQNPEEKHENESR